MNINMNTQEEMEMLKKQVICLSTQYNRVKDKVYEEYDYKIRHQIMKREDFYFIKIELENDLKEKIYNIQKQILLLYLTS